MTPEEKIECEALAYCCTLAEVVSRQKGDKFVRGGVFWATHKDSTEFAKESAEVAFGWGRFEGDWFIGYIQPGAVTAVAPEVKSMIAEDMFMCFVNVGTTQKTFPVTLNEMRSVCSEMNTGPRVTSKGGSC